MHELAGELIEFEERISSRDLLLEELSNCNKRTSSLDRFGRVKFIKVELNL